MAYPGDLDAIIELFGILPEVEKRETLITYAEGSDKCAPREGEEFELEDVRKDEECTDTVGIFLNHDPAGGAHFRVSLGPQVQTLTRAMTSILCKGLDGCSLEEILEVPSDFVPKIVGGELVRQRSQTVYYVLTRMKGAAKVLQRRREAAAG
jgi:cysteine desulfuration protein SufE